MAVRERSVARQSRLVPARTCLADAVSALLPDAKEAYTVMMKEMPIKGDTLPEHLAEALAAHGLSLKRASRDYFLARGPCSFHLLQEVDCKLVLHLLFCGLR